MGKRESGQLFQSDLYSFQEVRLVIFGLLGVLATAMIMSSCANRGVITGGEKDTIPPELLSSVPYNQSLDYNGTEIVLTFDERIQAPQLKRKLLITPFTDTPYKFKVNKYVVQLTFDEPFSDSTTYTLNFADAITDVTENNPGQNVSIAFSTWHVIDSLTIFGKIRDLLTDQPVEGAAVSVYAAQDTTDIFTDKPYYFAFTNEQGQFSIQNMRGGYYRIYAFKDENGNYLNESGTEAHGFIRDTLLIEEVNDSLRIGLILQDVQDLRFVNSRSQGNRFDVRYNKYVKSYSIAPLDSGEMVPANNLVSENLTIRFYNQGRVTSDSTGYILTAYDSVGNSQVDTVYAKFSEREVKPDEIEPSVRPASRASIGEELTVTMTFSKPIRDFNLDSLFVKYDTLRTDPIDSTGTWSWNENRTRLTLDLTLDRQYLPTALSEMRQRIDSLITLDTLAGIHIDSAKKQRGLKRKINPRRVRLYSGKGAFISVEDDSTSRNQYSYSFREAGKFGQISGRIEIDSTYFIVQLIDADYKVIRQVENETDYVFANINPGTYNVRVLVDADGDNQWSYGNIRLGTEPEPIYFHSTFIELRENWEINNINVTIPQAVNKL